MVELWMRFWRGVDGDFGLRCGELAEMLFSGGCGTRKVQGRREDKSEEEECAVPPLPYF